MRDRSPGEASRTSGFSWLGHPWTSLVLALVLYLIFALRFYHHTVDDAFISFRYALNLAHGYGLVYNPGERVEGYTNFLWVILLELCIKLHCDPESAARVLGLIAGAAMIVAVVRFSARLAPASTRWIAPLFVAVHPAMAVWAAGGMETPLFAALATWGIGLAAFELDAGALAPKSAVLLALAALTRPEGVLLAALVVLVALLFSLGMQGARGSSPSPRPSPGPSPGPSPRPSPRPSGRPLAVWIGVFLLLWLPYFIWRWSYYGYLFPNTFYAKVDVRGAEVARGLAYLNAFARNTGYWLLLPLAGLFFRERRPAVGMIAAATVATILYIVYVGGDGLPMYRFFVPALGWLFLLLAWGTEGWRARLRLSRPAMAIVALVLIAAAAWSARPNFSGRDYEYVQQDVQEVGTWKEIGLWLRQNAPPGDSLAVLPAGAMPYFSGLKTIDMLGLNDVTIAHTRVALGQGQAGHEKYNTAYVLRRAPTYVIVGVYDLLPQPLDPPHMVVPYYPVERELLMSDAFHERYRAEVAKTAGGYFVYFVRSAG